MTASRQELRFPRRVFFILAGIGIALTALTAASILLGDVALAGTFFVGAVICWAACRSVYAGYWRWQGTQGVHRAIVRLEDRVDEAQKKSHGKN